MFANSRLFVKIHVTSHPIKQGETMKQGLLIFASIVVVVGVQGIMAQEKAKDASVIKGFRGEFRAQLVDDEKKLVDLAEAIPQEKYGWRPAEGVRSISEVYTHIAETNYMFPTMMGVKMPDDLTRDAEKKITDKKKVVALLRQSFDYVRQVVANTPDTDLDKPAKFFGEETSVRGILFHLATHMHEHLGQSIAYARVNGVVPPWTAAEMKQQQGPKK